MTVLQTGWAFYNRTIPFIGRAKELHFLRETMRTVIEDRSVHSILLHGAPGIGKSRLLTEFCDTVDQHVGVVTVIHAACSPDHEPPYAVFQRLIRQRFYADPCDSDETVRSKLQDGLTQIFRNEKEGEEAAHIIGQLLGLPYPGSPYTCATDEDEPENADRARSWLVKMMRRDAERAPMLCAIDNLELASEETLQLAGFLANALRDCPVMMIGAASAKAEGSSKTPLLDHLKHTTKLEIAALSDSDSQKIVQALLLPANGPVDQIVQSVIEKAFGNPLSIEQILRLHIERGVIDPQQNPWAVYPELLENSPVSSNLREQVESRLSRLRSGERQILERAAILGESFPFEGLELLRRYEEGDADSPENRNWESNKAQDALQSVLESLKHRQILQQHSTAQHPDGLFSFRHQIEREVLCEGIEPERKRRLHLRVAQWLQGKEDPVRVAQHWDLGGSTEKAGLCYQQAGDLATLRHALPEAIALYDEALTRLDEEESPRPRLHLFHAKGKLHRTLGDQQCAKACFEQMLRLAWMLNDFAQGGLAFNKLGQIYRTLGEYENALEQFKKGLTLFRLVEDHRGIAASCDDIGRTYLMRGDLDVAEERLLEGLRLRQSLNDTRSEAVSLHHLGNLYMDRGDLKKALDTHLRALALSRQVHDTRTVTDILTSIGVIHYQRGDNEAALKLWDEALALSRITNEKQIQGILLDDMGEALLMLHRPEEAEDRLAEACQILEEVGDKRALTDALRNRGAVQLNMGEYQKALEFTQKALTIARTAGARVQIAQALSTLGEIYSETLYGKQPDREERIEKAQKFFNSALALFGELGLQADWARTAFSQGAFLAELNHPLEAKKLLEKVQTVCERLNLTELQKRTERILKTF